MNKIGTAQIDLSRVMREDEVKQWYTLKRGNKRVGEILVEALFVDQFD